MNRHQEARKAQEEREIHFASTSLGPAAKRTEVRDPGPNLGVLSLFVPLNSVGIQWY